MAAAAAAGDMGMLDDCAPMASSSDLELGGGEASDGEPDGARDRSSFIRIICDEEGR